MVFVVLFLHVLTWLFYYRAIPVVVVLVVFKYSTFKLRGDGRLGMQSSWTRLVAGMNLWSDTLWVRLKWYMLALLAHKKFPMGNSPP